MSLSVGSIPAPHASNGFHERYREALAAYISGSTADAELAYAIGRTALNEHRRLPDLLSVHHLALTAIIGKSPPFAARDDVLGKAGEFLTQVAAQFEVAHRGSPDAADHVHHLSEPLERQVAERTAALRDSEQRFQDMAEVSGDWMWETDREHRFARLFGHRIDSLPVRPEPLIGRTRWEAAAADSTNDDVWARHKADLDAHRPFRRFRYEIRSPDGRPMHVSASGKPFFDANGNFLGYRGTATDETAIVEAGHRVDEAEGLLRRVFETSLDLIVVTDSYGKLVRVSPSAKLLLGYDPEEMIGGSGVEFIYPEDLERTRDQMRAARRTGNPQSFECRYVHREGRTVTFWWQGIWSAAERQYFFSGRDITDRKRAERLQAYYAAIVESTADAIIATDLDGGVTSWNKAAELIFSYSASEMIGEPIICLLPSDRLEEQDAILAQIRRGERIEHFETMRRRKDGTVFPVSLTISPIFGPGGEIIGASKIVRDITERNRMEKDLRVSEEQLNRAQRLAQMGSDTRDLRTDIAVWSDETYRIFGIDRGAPVPSTEAFLQMVHPDDRAAILKARERLKKGGNPTPFEYRFVRADGSVRHIHRESEVIKGEDGNPLYMMGTIHDITDRRRTEEQLRQAQKMEAIGNLTGGMAHDFNNLLGVIVGNLDLASAQIGNDEELKELVGEALEAAWRGADLTRRLLAFARRQPLRPARVEVNDLVNDTVRLLRRLLGEDIEVSVDLGGKLWPVTVDPAQLEASLANLATNARDAMPGGGRLIIATANRRLDADYAAAHSDVTTGDFVTIEISDTGTGMPPEVVSQIFEPFFTTKEQGRGTGLGLSMVFGFLRQSGGHVNVYSELGKGTTFRLYLPRADDDEAPREIVQVAPISRGAGETVLMVEDNPGMRRIVLRQLRNLGYYVLDCDSGAAALDILQREPVDLLLTDIVMPGGLDGVELAHVAQQRWPALKIVLTSGFPQARVNGDGGLGGLQLLSKPYHREELAAALRTALSG